MKKNIDRIAFKLIGLISTVALAFLFWLIYIKESTQIHMPFVAHLPAFNAFFNSCSAIALSIGLWAILSKRPKLHRQCMLSAFAFSTLFLISYIIYHYAHGDTRFLAEGWVRPVYFFILISHIVLSVVILPLILTTFYFALTNQLERHKPIARWTWPLWMYVSITGVLIYVFLAVFNP